jgi:Zn-finger nucleic acid-binding protein
MLRCPLCSVPMREVPRRGVKIDVCPECRGVWLDAGEMERLLNRAEEWEEEDFRHYRGREEREYAHHPYGRKKRRHFLDDLFDVFG